MAYKSFHGCFEHFEMLVGMVIFLLTAHHFQRNIKQGFVTIRFIITSQNVQCTSTQEFIIYYKEAQKLLLESCIILLSKFTIVQFTVLAEAPTNFG